MGVGSPSEPQLKRGVLDAGPAVTGMGTRLQHLKYLDPAEELRSGVSTDQELRPLDGEGRVAYTNLYAAGAVLGGYDYSGSCAFGVPIRPPWLARRLSARFKCKPTSRKTSDPPPAA